MAKKRFGVHCAVSWCVCLATKKSLYCAVHEARGKDYGPTKPATASPEDCDECDGTGDCQECDGDGTHQCGHDGCTHEHDCGACDGNGECQACSNGREPDSDSFDARYLAFAFDPGWVPPVLITYPWEQAS